MSTNFNRSFPIKKFNKSSIDAVIEKGSTLSAVMPKSEQYKEVYDNFNEQFKLYLSKLPNSKMKQQVTLVFNRGLIYLGTTTSNSQSGIYCRPLQDNTHTYAYVLLTNQVDIDLKTGDVKNIDEAIFSSYQGIIRDTIISFKEPIKKDIDLNKLLATYFYLTVLKALGKENIYNEKQKNFIYIVCLYAYYRSFLEQRAGAAQSIIERHFRNESLLQYYEEFLPRFKDIDKYSEIKDLPKMLIDAKIIIEPPNSIMMFLIKSLKLNGFYSLIGSLDLLVSMAILSKYPTEMFTRYSLTSEKIQNNIEDIIIKYSAKIKYKETSLLR